jgi:hypothetical protein
VNEQFAALLTEKKVAHEFRELPGDARLAVLGSASERVAEGGGGEVESAEDLGVGWQVSGDSNNHSRFYDT